jgi:hypothetical protein
MSGNKAANQIKPSTIAHASQPAVWSADKERQPLPVSADLEGPRKRLHEALGNTLSDEFVEVILGKLVEALRPVEIERATAFPICAAISFMAASRAAARLFLAPLGLPRGCPSNCAQPNCIIAWKLMPALFMGGSHDVTQVCYRKRHPESRHL